MNPSTKSTLYVNLFPLKRIPQEGRIFRFAHRDPQSFLKYLQAMGWIAQKRGDEVWIFALERPEVRAPFVGEAEPASLQERAMAFNSHLNRLLSQKGFYRTGSRWIDPEEWTRIEGVFLSGPFQGKAFPVRQHQAYKVEVVNLLGTFYALVDLSKQLLSDAPLEALSVELVAYLEAQAPKHPLHALDLHTGRRTFWEKADPRGHLLLHPVHLEELGVVGEQGQMRRTSQEAFERSQFDFAHLLEKITLFSEVLVPEPLALSEEALGRIEGLGLRMAKGLAAEPKEVRFKGFLYAPSKISLRPILPDAPEVAYTQKVTKEPSFHVETKRRGKPPQRSGHLEHRATVAVSPRHLLLYHLVEPHRLKNSREGLEILERFGHIQGKDGRSLVQALKQFGTSIQVAQPALRYNPTTGEIQGSPTPGSSGENEVNFILAPPEVGRYALGRLLNQLKNYFPKAADQVVNPDTLESPIKLLSLAYDLLVGKLRAAVPYALKDLGQHVLGLRATQEDGFLWRLIGPEGFVLGKGKGFPPDEILPRAFVVHFMGNDRQLEEVLDWTHEPVVRLELSDLRFSQKNLPLGTFFRATPEVAYLLAHPGHPGWPTALRVEVIQGGLTLEEALKQVYWLTKPTGGLYHPGKLPLSVEEKVPWDQLRPPQEMG